MTTTDNLRILALNPLVSPDEIMSELPATETIRSLVSNTRNEIANIIKGEDDRIVVVVGPCSIHDSAAAYEYAAKLVDMREKYKDELCILMRVYFEKPRTTVGWKGLINDPNLDGSFNIKEGLQKAREILLKLNELGLPTATEFLDTTIPQYIADLVSWAAIGARTTESQIHREMASGLSMPVGFKNGTQGNIDIAIDAVLAATHPHHFLGVSGDGNAAIVSTTGNPNCHVILRGGKITGPNYSTSVVNETSEALASKKQNSKVMVDCSHGNSLKQHEKQFMVLDSVCKQRQSSHNIFGVMIESFLKEGNQPLSDNLEYGKSITDACIHWDDTERALEQLATSVKEGRS
jgi:3-deoxy-7-phosphoheptulonate synthase